MKPPSMASTVQGGGNLLVKRLFGRPYPYPKHFLTLPASNTALLAMAKPAPWTICMPCRLQSQDNTIRNGDVVAHAGSWTMLGSHVWEVFLAKLYTMSEFVSTSNAKRTSWFE